MGNIYKNVFLDRYLFHTRKVQDNMIMLDNNLSKLNLDIKDFELFRRAMFHDVDKLQPNMIDAYIEASRYHFDKKNNIEYKFDAEKCKKINEIHYNTQRHHFYKNEIQTPSDVDICEMCSDITAVSIERKEENNIYYYKNFMIKEYPKLERYNNKILLIFNVLWKLQTDFTYENKQKYNHIKEKVEKIRNFQDAMIFLEKNNDKLPFKIEDYEIFRRAICLDNSIFNNNYSFFVANKNVDDLEICVFCSECFANEVKDVDRVVDGNDGLKERKKDIENVMVLLGENG